MIQHQFCTIDSTTWQDDCRDLITDGQALLAQLNLSASEVGLSTEAAKQFRCRVPRPFVAKMQPGNPKDPLLLQVLPSVEELEIYPGYSHDPLDEQATNPIPGLLHKYHGRVLLTLTGSCAVNCRYCFRRHFPYQDNAPGTKGWQAAIDYVTKNPTIHEVIFSGGDPLMLSDEKLLSLADAFVAIAHVKTIRIHSRLPVVIPKRLTQSLLAGLQKLESQVVMVLHANHPKELDSSLAIVRDYPITMLNQAVLLRGVNDNVDTLAGLSTRLFELGILPYYLHMLDPVSGAGHFEVPLVQARALYLELQARLPGYLVPKLAQEKAGERNKVLLAGV